MNNPTQQDSLDELKIAIRHKVNDAYQYGLEGVDPYNANVPLNLTTDQLLELFHSHLEKQEKATERRGEISQLKMLYHWASGNRTSVNLSDLRHFILSLEQVPDQPLASEDLVALGKTGEKP